MDKSIPAGAAILLEFIYKTETGRDAPECYEVLFGHRQDRLDKPLTKMTIEEVQAGQSKWAKWGKPASSAAGAAQFMRATLKGLIEELKLRPTQVFNGNLQDRLAYHLLRRRGFDKFIAGQMSITQFGLNLAKEWASLPVLAATKGAHRQLKAGESYYAGDGVNKDLTSPATVRNILKKVLEAGGEVQPQEPVEVPQEPVPDVPGTPTNPEPVYGGIDWLKVIMIVGGVALALFFILT